MQETHKVGTNTGNRGKGRPKGSPNKTTREAKDAIAMVAEGLGGPDRMLAWAQEDPQNERIFWQAIYPKLLPLTLSGDQNNPVRIQEVRRLVVDPAK